MKLNRWTVRFILLTLLTTGVVSINVSASQPTIEYKAPFFENYTFIKQVGKGTYSTVFLAENNFGEQVVIKQYAINDQQMIDLFKKNGINSDAFIQQLAQQEEKVGRLTNHPNIVKVRKVYCEDSTAYIVMDYVKGQSVTSFHDYSLKMRTVLMQQLLSAMEHLLTRNVIIDDLWSGNILIDNDHLTLIDLGGFQVIDDDADMPVGDYLEMIESMLTTIGEDAAQRILISNEHLLPQNLRVEIISSSHVEALVSWVEALQEELNTVNVLS